MVDVSALVLSCDKNIDVCEIFFEQFRKYWKNCKYPVYLGLEQEEFKVKGVQVLQSDAQSWAERVMDYLKKIPSPYVLILLDDFVIEEPVDVGMVDYYADLIKENCKIANITFENIPDIHNQVSTFTYLQRRTSRANYLVNLQVGLWRKDILLSLLRKKENPWQTEIYGSIRARAYSDYIFLCMDSDDHMPIKNGRGWLIVRGKWNVEELERLQIDKEQLNSKREFAHFNRNDVLVPWYKRIDEVIGSRYRKLLSVFQIYI